MTVGVETTNRRVAIYRGLRARNRVVGVLRIGLPALGLLVFAIFAGQIFLASIRSQFGIGRISFNGDTITLDTPSYSGVMANGAIYKITAEGATTVITNPNVIELKNAKLVLTKPDGTVMTAEAVAGAFETLGQTMTVPGTANITDSTGNSGTLDQVVADLPHQTLTATGHVLINLAGGRSVDGIGMFYTATTGIWTFGKSTVTLADTPGPDDDAEDAP